MKNLENYGVQELGAKEKIEIDGGYACIHYENGVKIVEYYRRNGHGGWDVYKRWEGGIQTM